MKSVFDGQSLIIGATVATEVPPLPTNDLKMEEISLAAQYVCDVIRNRAAGAGFPKTAIEVVLQAGQFSAVCRQDYWRKALAGRWFPHHVTNCVEIWLERQGQPALHDATHYYSPVSMDPAGSVPNWVSQMEEVFVGGVPTKYFRWFKLADP